MSVELRSYLSLALTLTLASACGEDEGAIDRTIDYGPTVTDAGALPDAATPGLWDASLPAVDAGQPAPTVDGAVAQTDAGVGSDSGSDAGSDGGPVGEGDCCPDGNCLCHGPDPKELTSAKGPYKTAELMTP